MAYFNDEDSNWLGNWDDEAEDVSGDPFDGLTKTDQDLFFRMLDLMPEQLREEGMDYFMSRPRQLRAVIKSIKLKKTLIKNQDREGLNKLLAKEYAAITQNKQLSEAGTSNPEDTDSSETGEY